MPRRSKALFWKALLVLLTVGSQLHAQSDSGSLSWLPQADAHEHPTHASAPSCFESAVDPNAAPTPPGGNAQPLRLAASALAGEVNPDSTVTSAGLSPQSTPCEAWSGSQQRASGLLSHQSGIADGDTNLDGDSKASTAAVIRPRSQPDLDRGVYYRNKLEFSFDAGWLPINIPFVFDVFLGDAYTRAPLNYTLVPLVASLRWHIDDVGGPWIFRGNWDMTVSGSITLIPRGPETRYFSYDMGIRRNFVPRRGKVAPYFDGRLGLGQIDAKGPLGVQFSQGQDFTFTMNLGSGLRYNFNPRYSLSVGLNWMHISNLYLSEPAFSNYGINVYGPMFGIDMRLGRPRHHASE